MGEILGGAVGAAAEAVKTATRRKRTAVVVVPTALLLSGFTFLAKAQVRRVDDLEARERGAIAERATIVEKISDVKDDVKDVKEDVKEVREDVKKTQEKLDLVLQRLDWALGRPDGPRK